MFTAFNVLVIFSAALALISIPIYICVCIVLLKGRYKQFASSFYRVFFILAILDILASINNIIGVFLPNWGIMVSIVSKNAIFGKAYLTLAWWLRMSQGMSSVAIALNRATAVLFPLKYVKLWNIDKMPYMMAIQIFFGAPFGIFAGFGRIGYEIHWNQTGQVMNSLFLDKDYQAILFDVGGVIETLFFLTIIIAYIAMLIKVLKARKKRQKVAAEKNEIQSSKSGDSAATVIAFCICGVELIYYIYTVISILYDLPLDLFYNIYSFMTNIYSSLNCYLLMIFSGMIRKSVRRLIFGLSAEEQMISITIKSQVSNASHQ